MNQTFKTRAITIAVILAFPVGLMPITARAGFYPPLPPSLSTSVAPNVLLHIDNSGSMASKPDKYATKTKMASAIDAATTLVTNNTGVRWGIFAFDVNSGATAGKLLAPIGSSTDTLKTVISGLSAKTNTPLGEALFEMTRYYSGSTSYYKKISGNYTSPIQYRCQKNFAIVITDGVSNGDNDLPGLGSKSALAYTSYDTSGNALNKSFKVCTDTSTVSDISCPAKLEGSTTNNAFVGTADSATTYGRSIRDVAMYAYDADLRVGGTDTDNQSFDDPKFKKQNLITYTVGFAINDPVLSAAAIVGGGTYQTAGNEAALNTALSSAINDIMAQNSNGGGITPRSDVKYVGNTVLQPLFNSKGWYGELRCKTLNTDGTIGGDCTIPKATIPAAGSRKIYTSKVTNALSTSSSNSTAFSFDTASTGVMTTAQKTALGSSTTEINSVVDWVRGSDGSLRARSNGLLGDMIETQPVIIAAPSGFSVDADYSTFQNTNANRGIALIGANDGMMHAFSLSSLGEIMGYVPAAVYGNLKLLTKADYGSTTGGTPHTYYVSGASRSEDIKIGNDWKTLFVSGLGQGGQGYFALDATSEATLTGGATNAVKWELTDTSDQRMGYTFGAPVIYNVRTSASTATPAVILSNGYENNYNDTSTGGVATAAKSSVLYVVNASTGALISSIEVAGSTGLSSPAGWDSDADGIVDYVYAGDMDGKVWRFDLTQAGGFKVSASPIFNAGSTQPVVQRPGIFPTGNEGEAMVLFGTGKLLVDGDRTDTSVQALYGIVDRYQNSASSSSSSASSTPASLITTAEAQTAAKSDLIKQSIVATYTETGSTRRAGTYRKMSENTVDLTAKRGWYVELPGSGERLLTSPMVYEDKVLFGTGLVQSGQVCLSGGKGWIMGLNPLTGSVPTGKVNGRQFSFVDLDGDKRATVADQISFSGGAAYAVGYDLPAMPTELSVISDSNASFTLNTSGAYGTAGTTIALRDSNLMAVFRPVLNKGTGTITVGEQGSDTIHTESLLGPSTGVRVETGPWRELK